MISTNIYLFIIVVIVLLMRTEGGHLTLFVTFLGFRFFVMPLTACVLFLFFFFVSLVFTFFRSKSSISLLSLLLLLLLLLQALCSYIIDTFTAAGRTR